MSIIRILCALVVLSVPASSVSHAETPDGKQVGQLASAGVTKTVEKPVNVQELSCLARNIYYEAGNEPDEGKVAVGLVTLNRTGDQRFSRTVCGVVNQKIPTNRAHGHSPRAVCQFSWRCVSVRLPSNDDENWRKSQLVARNLLINPVVYQRLEHKYWNALYFHEVHVRPLWVRHKQMVARIGGHLFYRDYQSA